MKQFFALLFIYLSISCTANQDKEKKELMSTQSVAATTGKVPKEILEAGEAVLTNTCQLCHNDTSKLGAPNLGVLGSMTPSAIVKDNLTIKNGLY